MREGVVGHVHVLLWRAANRKAIAGGVRDPVVADIHVLASEAAVVFGLWEAAAPPIAVLVDLVRVIPTVVPPAEPMKFRTKKYPEPELPSPATA